jgi:ketosteroid isomerase-like protein
MRRTILASAVLVAMWAGACAHATIPHTEIEDTPENRQILKIVESYHRALENRDADALVILLSPRYYEDNGNVDSQDDYDLEGLREGIIKDFERTQRIQLDMKVEDIVVNDETETAFAYVLYSLKAQSDFPVGPKWKTSSDRARFEFERRNNRWLIVSGI